MSYFTEMINPWLVSLQTEKIGGDYHLFEVIYLLFLTNPPYFSPFINTGYSVTVEVVC